MPMQINVILLCLQDHMHSLAAAGKIRESDADSATLFVLADVNNSRSSNPMQSVGQSVGQVMVFIPSNETSEGANINIGLNPVNSANYGHSHYFIIKYQK